MNTYGKTNLIDDLTKATSGLTRGQITDVLNTALDLIQNNVRAGNRVTITGFGTWQQSRRAARMGVNPQTRAKLQIPASTGVRWTAGSVFKQAVGGKGRGGGKAQMVGRGR